MSALDGAIIATAAVIYIIRDIICVLERPTFKKRNRA